VPSRLDEVTVYSRIQSPAPLIEGASVEPERMLALDEFNDLVDAIVAVILVVCCR